MRRKVVKVIETMINPAVASHGGQVHLVDIMNDVVYVRLSGGCHGCSASTVTLKQGIRRIIMEEFPQIQEVVDVTDHASGESPYYS